MDLNALLNLILESDCLAPAYRGKGGHHEQLLPRLHVECHTPVGKGGEESTHDLHDLFFSTVGNQASECSPLQLVSHNSTFYLQGNERSPMKNKRQAEEEREKRENSSSMKGRGTDGSPLMPHRSLLTNIIEYGGRHDCDDSQHPHGICRRIIGFGKVVPSV